jgi:RNA polymerase sigma-70 factor (ECF subfamily)
LAFIAVAARPGSCQSGASRTEGGPNEFPLDKHNEHTDVTASASFPASLITLTYDDATAPQSRRSVGASLLERVAHGDGRAARECIDRFGGLVWSIACRSTRTHADIEETVQEIFADVWRSAARYHPEHGSEEVFITMIARRRLIDRMRRAAHGGLARASDDNDALGWGDPSISADVCDEARAARRSIMRLRPELRMVLKLAVLQGSTHLDIAHRLQVPLHTVKTMMARALIQVREFMASRE